MRLGCRCKVSPRWRDVGVHDQRTIMLRNEDPARRWEDPFALNIRLTTISSLALVAGASFRGLGLASVSSALNGSPASAASACSLKSCCLRTACTAF